MGLPRPGWLCWPNKSLYSILILYLITSIFVNNGICEISFDGIPAAFGDLDHNRRTDIVYIGDDGKSFTVLYQGEPQQELKDIRPPKKCKSDHRIAQIYITDIDNDGEPDLLALLMKEDSKGSYYDLVKIHLENDSKIFKARLTSNTAYLMTSPTSAPLFGDGPIPNNNSHALPLVSKNQEDQTCFQASLGINLTSQPFLFDLEGDLGTDFLALDHENKVSCWKSDPKKLFKPQFRTWMTNHESVLREHLGDVHSNGFIDMNNDSVADIVLSEKNGYIAYLFSDPRSDFNQLKRIRLDPEDRSISYTYGQSSLVDIDADGKIDHLIPRCNPDSCDILLVASNGFMRPIFNFKNESKDNSYDFKLDVQKVGKYELPVMLRASDLDGDGYTDFVAVAEERSNHTMHVIYLHNIPLPGDHPLRKDASISRSFEIQVIPPRPNQEEKNAVLVTLFDVDEDGKVDMLIGRTKKSLSEDKEPRDIKVTVEKNKQMVDACFMKVLVTNGKPSEDSYGLSARGPHICFELSQNDGNKMHGCSGQQTQASHFALQQPYVIFGLGQTPHFVEKLTVTIPGWFESLPRHRTLEQIVPDAQIIIIPKNPNSSSSWDYKMFLEPMTELVPPTLIALAVICMVLIVIIYFLHRQETLEDAAEHEEYKRHWPESRG